jgi:hypothetical protein
MRRGFTRDIRNRRIFVLAPIVVGAIALWPVRGRVIVPIDAARRAH